MKKLFAVLQKIGKSLMLPVSVLPAAGLLLRLGQPDLLNIPFMVTAGDAIFQNLSMIFAVGVAIGFSGGEGVAALAAVVGEYILEGIIKLASANAATAAATTEAVAQGITLDAFKLTADYSDIVSRNTINMGVFGGIIIGLTAAILYNKYHNIKLPQVLGFFGGKRFVPIVTSVVALIIAFIGVNVWPILQGGIDVFAHWASTSIFGPAFYAAGKRLLIPIGLHHMYYPAFLYQFGEFVSNGVTYFGDSARYFHGDPAAGVFMASEYPVIMFGLPGAALAMIFAAKKENRKAVSGMLVSAAFVAFLTGITEPIEFSFIFVAPLLFVFHVVAAFASGIITSLLNIRLGYTFSASFIDYVLGFKFAGNPWSIWIVGIIFFALYFAVFYFSIKAFNLKTPGREDAEDDELAEVGIKDLKGLEKAARVLQSIGGKENIQVLDACITRLRLTLDNTEVVDKRTLKALGAAGIMEAGNSVQVIFGTEAERIKDDIRKLMSDENLLKESLKLNDVDISRDFKEEIKEKEASEVRISSDTLINPIDGKVVELSEVPDEVFSQKLLGDGFAVDTTGNKIFAPTSGEVVVLFPTKHAVAINAESGLEILVHIGIDTVELQGEGFTSHVNVGDKVKKGDLLITIDRDKILSAGKSLVTPVIITNMDKVEELKTNFGEEKALKDVSEIKIK
ncbi:glucose PTS transporter subunit IIA [Clostridium frigidicarnis]|uniref:PTS system D-glucosamine-specific IIA component, Glc family /PTS system D-glucosamine-specific IIB component, Glc family /PTS system D-glucosamine-specific IIC component, Glc family n=1 Tax=Clostridium frigidicarnis TaxID=84698 RepID=A0A1I0ZG35_9CLOT|nr:glucose PTS transporter subunit IIA [Clostridium frigidicarnis]SFB24357.1 PTS system D-glucosamine-specific IIA component, Glc family /PTS system D-glucosamine-specific IIB component, Glc family /PTS system D-glucosamine-specific IIC component, Glc family [Clostridium frigidicarnis]